MIASVVQRAVTIDELATLLIKAGAAGEQEQVLEAIKQDIAECPEAVESDGRIVLVTYAAFLHRATR